MMDHHSNTYDVLIVGSGLVAATYARLISDLMPTSQILIVDAGMRLSVVPGTHVASLGRKVQRTWARARSDAWSSRQDPAAGSRSGFFPGTSQIEGAQGSSFAAASQSTCIGGMGVHWTGACPRPSGSEVIPWIPSDEWLALIRQAELLLEVTDDIFALQEESSKTLALLQSVFAPLLGPEMKVSRMPMAARRVAGNVQITDPATVLGKNLNRTGLHIWSNTLCKEIITNEDTAMGARLYRFESEDDVTVFAKAVVVAGDSFRTPQLLWASGIRPRTLGKFLNEHQQVVGIINPNNDLGEYEAELASSLLRGNPEDVVLTGHYRVPFSEPGHIAQGQVLELDFVGKPTGTQSRLKATVLSWWSRKEDLSDADGVSFSEESKDTFGMPLMTFSYSLTPRDQLGIDQTFDYVHDAAAALGNFLPGKRPTPAPPGASLHYQGTVRAGEAPDGFSICDPFCRVWGFQNLFLGGNGVIPTSTVCNPTLTTVALAIRAAKRLVALLSTSAVRTVRVNQST